MGQNSDKKATIDIHRFQSNTIRTKHEVDETLYRRNRLQNYFTDPSSKLELGRVLAMRVASYLFHSTPEKHGTYDIYIPT